MDGTESTPVQKNPIFRKVATKLGKFLMLEIVGGIIDLLMKNNLNTE